MFLSASIPLYSATVWPGTRWETAAPAEVGLNAEKLQQARDYALTGDGSGCVVQGGKLVMSWGDLNQTYDLKSSTKSFGAAALGLAILDGKVQLHDRAGRYHPELGTSASGQLQAGWLADVTLFHLATQTAGFEKPGGYGQLLFPPGSQWHYSDGGPNWLAEVLTLAYQQDLDQLMFERVFEPIGIQRTDLTWRKNSYRPEFIQGIKRREFGAGISANVEAMARFGYLHLRGGQWAGRQLLSSDFVALVSRTPRQLLGLPIHQSAPRATSGTEDFGRAADHYGLLWWNNNDGTLPAVPRDAYWSWGLYDSLIVVIPNLDLVVARVGKSWKRTVGGGHYAVLEPFLGPIVAAAQVRGTGMSEVAAALACPPSALIKEIRWSPKAEIVRRAAGSDNWPLTWGADDGLYSAYGDGNGFEPFVSEKLSLGLAKIVGRPPDIQGVNLRSPSVEQKGEGAAGRKASGILMADGLLYLWVRNAGNSQLAWSRDEGSSWEWANWRFTNSFGCPTFLNFGRNYAGARDDFVYTYSPDGNSAYEPADRMVLARAPKNRLQDRAAYEFFAALDSDGKVHWIADLRQRGAVFTNPHKCYRSGVTYNAPLQRYLWCQILPASKHPQGPRFQGGFSIYEAPEPWGPWRTVFHTDEWDVGPGETSSFPTKWMSADGTTLSLVFSGDDCFSVRGATLVLSSER